MTSFHFKKIINIKKKSLTTGIQTNFPEQIKDFSKCIVNNYDCSQLQEQREQRQAAVKKGRLRTQSWEYGPEYAQSIFNPLT